MAGPNMSRNQNLAGQSVKQGNYTITYNDAGYAVKASKDGGKSATSTVKTTNANNSENHKAAYEAAQRGDWDAVGTAVNRIGMQTPDGYGGYDMTEANKYMSELQDEFGYNSEDYIRKKYDGLYGSGAYDAMDVGGSVSTGGANLALSGGTALNGTKTESGSREYDDAVKYIEDLFAKNLEAELSALQTAYEKNVSEIERKNKELDERYLLASNQAAAQNMLEQQRMNEMGMAAGLNTGTSGQMALGQSMAYQGTVGNLLAQQEQQKAENDRMLAQLLADYESDVQQATARSNAQRAQALLDELRRQQTLDAETEAESSPVEKPVLTYSQVMSAIENGTLTPNVLSAYAYYMGEPYSGSIPGTPSPSPVKNYDNGGLTPAQVMELQRFVGASADGKWGPQSSGQVGGATAKDAWNAYQAAMSVTDYSTASEALKNAGSSAGNLLTAMEFVRHKNSGNSSYASYPTYQDYLRDAVFAALI